MKKYKYTIGNIGYHSDTLEDQSSLEIDCALALLPLEILEARVDALIGTNIWEEDEDENLTEVFCKDLERLRSQYSTAVLSVAIGTLKQEGRVLIMLDSLTVRSFWDFDPSKGSEGYITIELVQ